MRMYNNLWFHLVPKWASLWRLFLFIPILRGWISTARQLLPRPVLGIIFHCSTPIWLQSLNLGVTMQSTRDLELIFLATNSGQGLAPMLFTNICRAEESRLQAEPPMKFQRIVHMFFYVRPIRHHLWT